MTYLIIAAFLVVLELSYFRVAERFNIIDKPNQRSSHTSITMRGGGVVFYFGALIFFIASKWMYPWFFIGLTLLAVVCFVDDIRSLPGSVRLVTQFAAMALLFFQLGVLHWQMWWVLLIGLVVCVGATNVINFMDGINGITAGYSLVVMVSLAIVNSRLGFIEDSYLWIAMMALLVFAFFNFRPKGKARCFAGDVGSVSIAFIMLFAILKLVLATHDATWLIFLLVYGVDGCLTICHRILLHENLGEAHRKHAFQLMANELKMPHPLVSSIYMVLQFSISLSFIYLCPNTTSAHWLFLLGVALVLGLAYVLFMKKYYPLHEAYLKSLKKETDGK